MIRAAVLAAAAAVVLAAPAAAPAGVATTDGSAVRFTDPAGVETELFVVVDGRPGMGWLTSFAEAGSPTQAGPGCAAGAAATECPTATPPAVVVEGGLRGDELGVEGRGTPPGSVTLRGGAGVDNLYTAAVAAVLDGGAGDDLLQPDLRTASHEAPGPTPGSVLRGGSGEDTAGYALTLTRVVVSLDGVANDGQPGERDNVLPDVEDVSAGDHGSVLTGSAAGNRLEGGAGRDRLTGGAGRDDLAGDTGGDTLNALDGDGGDSVSCGIGIDLAWVDAGDDVVDADQCERQAWAPRLVRRTLAFRDGRITAALECPPEAARCRGTLVVRDAATPARRAARGRYRLRGGQAARVRLRPGAAAGAALRDGRTLRGELRVQPRGASAPAGPAVTVRP